jgi:hypothetical protein
MTPMHCEECGDSYVLRRSSARCFYCGYCPSCWREGWAQVAERCDAVTLRTVGDLYMASPRYATELLDWCEANGWRVYTGEAWSCFRRLEDARHRCSMRGCPITPRGVDHPVWVVRPDRSAFALLSQEYPNGLRVDDSLPLAPYGHGTRLRVLTSSPLSSSCGDSFFGRWMS